MSESRGFFKTLRDAAFFRCCGIPRFAGIPYTADARRPRQKEDGSYEYEGARLARCLRELGDTDLNAANAFDLMLNNEERNAARNALSSVPPGMPILAISIGAKVDVKDWGDTNWIELLARLSDRHKGWALITIGALSERRRSDVLRGAWRGVSLNLCGDLTVRESGAALEMARIFIGHDSGPMHLAAAVQTATVAVFSSRNLPGEWFPFGTQNRVLYRRMPCEGCNLDVCTTHGKACITSISVDDVFREIEQVLHTPLVPIARPVA